MPHPETAAWKLFPELGGGIGYAEGLGFRAFVAHRNLPGCASSSLRASGDKTGVSAGMTVVRFGGFGLEVSTLWRLCSCIITTVSSELGEGKNRPGFS